MASARSFHNFMGYFQLAARNYTYRIVHTTTFVTPIVEQWLEREIAQCVHNEGSIKKEGNVLFNDAFNTFYLRLYGVGHMVNDHSDRREETCCCHMGKGSFICTIPYTG